MVEVVLLLVDVGVLKAGWNLCDHLKEPVEVLRQTTVLNVNVFQENVAFSQVLHASIPSLVNTFEKDNLLDMVTTVDIVSCLLLLDYCNHNMAETNI